MSNFDSGDFRSQYCNKLLSESDIVVTNPPFSLFREFFAWLMKADKKFIIVGNQNAIAYKELFPYMREDKVRLGSQKGIASMFFEVTGDMPIPPDAEKYVKAHLSEDVINGRRITYLRTTCWFTNCDLNKHHEPLVLVEKYTPEKYPKYDNYDAIEVSKVKEIPCDYDGVMGVPITYMYSHNPDQFEILGLSSKNECGDVTVLHDRDYYRGFIRGKVAVNVDSTMPLLTISGFGGTKCVNEDGRVVYQLYHRLFIRRKVVN